MNGCESRLPIAAFASSRERVLEGWRSGLPFLVSLQVFIFAALGPIITGCGGTPGPSKPIRTVHLIEASGIDLLDPDQLMEQRIGPTWSGGATVLVSESGEKGVQTQGHIERPLPSEFEVMDSGLVLWLETEISSDDVTLVQVEGRIGSGWAELRWVADGKRFPAGRPMTATARDSAGIKRDSIDFEVHKHPQWHGQIEGLEIRFVAPPQEKTVASIEAIRCIKKEVTVEAVKRTADRPWLVDVGGEVRPSHVSLIGEPLSMPVDMPVGARELRFGIGGVTGGSLEGTVHIDLDVDGRMKNLGELPVLLENNSWENITVSLPPKFKASTRVNLSAVFTPPVREEVSDQAQVMAWGNLRLVAQMPEMEELPNIILISLDTLRADHTSLHGYGRSTTPFLESFAQSSAVTFENVVAQAPWTLPSHASLFTGLDSFRHGTNHHHGIDSGHTLMAEILRASGYSTLGITGGGYLHPQYGFAQGFDSYRYWKNRSLTEDELERGVENALQLMDSRESSPFFLFFHTYEVHAPFRARAPFFETYWDRAVPANLSHATTKSLHPGPSEGFRGKRKMYFVFNDGENEWDEPVGTELADLPVALYDSGVAFTDLQIQALLQGLEDRGLLENSIVVVTSDHGEALGEHDLAGHPFLYDDNLMVPLIIALPDRRFSGQRVSAQVRLIDVLPTVLDLAGLQTSHESDGLSLVNLMGTESQAESRDAWSYAASNNHGLALRQDNKIKFIFNDSAWLPIAEDVELYLVDRDPGESENMAGDSDVADSLSRRARATLDRELAGVRLKIESLQDEELTLRLSGPPVAPGALKTSGMSGAVVRWRGREGAEVTLDPRGSATLYLINLSGVARRLAVMTNPRSGSNPLELDLDEISSPTAWILSPSGVWDAADSSQSRGRVHLSVEWRYREVFSVGIGDRASADPGLLDQLRALGYVVD